MGGQYLEDDRLCIGLLQYNPSTVVSREGKERFMVFCIYLEDISTQCVLELSNFLFEIIHEPATSYLNELMMLQATKCWTPCVVVRVGVAP